MKKILTILIMSMFLICLASAQTNFNLGTFKQNTNITLIQTCENCTYVNLSTVFYPNSSVALSGEYLMNKNGMVYTFSFNDTDALGTYFYVTHGDLNEVDTLGTVEFVITRNGKEFSIASAILYVSLFIVLILFMLVIFFVINKLPDSNERDEGGRILSISYLKYLRQTFWFVEWMLVVTVLYLSSNLAFAFAGEELFAQILLTLFRITFGITPIIVIVWLAWIFVSMFHDKQFQQMLNRGMFPSGKL